LTTGRVGQIYRQYRKEKTTATTSYGTINTMVPDAGTVTSLADYVAGALGDVAGDYDIDAIVEEYRDAINERLADQGITLRSAEVYGPYPRIENAGETIADAIEDGDFWAIVARHDTTA